MAKKVSKKVEKKEKDTGLDFLKEIQKSIKSKTLIIDDNLESFIPYHVPFKHKGLQKITGGLLGGKVMLIEGHSQSGKSWLLYELMANAIKMGGYSYLVDAERAFEPIYGKAAGIDYAKKSFLIDESTVVEEIHRNIENFVKKVREKIKDPSIPIVVGIDSTAALRCAEQYENDSKGKDTGYGYMKRANAVYQMVDTLIPLMDELSFSLVIIGQLRTKHNAGMFEDPDKGMLKELVYRCHQILRGKLSTLERDQDEKVKRTAQNVNWFTEKNRHVKAKQTIKVKYDYDKGLLPYSGLLDLLAREKEIIKADMKDPEDGRKKIKGCYVVGDESKTFYPLISGAELFRGHPHLLEPNYIKVHDIDDSLGIDGDESEGLE